jgi:hypothetical protein
MGLTEMVVKETVLVWSPEFDLANGNSGIRVLWDKWPCVTGVSEALWWVLMSSQRIPRDSPFSQFRTEKHM